MTPEMLQLLGYVIGPAGAAWVAVKVSLNGTRENVKTIMGDVKELRAGQAQHSNRLTAIETKLGGQTEH